MTSGCEKYEMQSGSRQGNISNRGEKRTSGKRVDHLTENPLDQGEQLSVGNPLAS